MQHRRLFAAVIVISLFSTLGLGLLSGPASSVTEAVEIEGKTGSVSLSLAQLQAMPSIQGDSSYQNRFGNWRGIGTYVGVNISNLVILVGGMVQGDTVTIYADDGYNQTFSYNNVYNTWSNTSIQGPMFLAYSFNGTTVPTWTDGLRIAFMPSDQGYSNDDCTATTTPDQIVSSGGTRWVSSVERIVVNPAPWTVTLKKDTSTITYGGQQLENFTGITAAGAFKKTTGTIVGPNNFTGVNVSELLQPVGGMSASDSITVVSRDSYEMTFTYDQVMGNASTWMVLAYYIDGVDMPIGDVPRIVFVGPDAPITDGHLWQKQVSSIEVAPAVTEYTLHLVGAYTLDMDRQTLESGINCHGVNYTVGEKTYTGIPLWYLCGFVDDPHWAGNHSFRDGLNYTVTVFASDNYNKTLTYQTMTRNNTIIVANQLNGTRLTGMDPPLMLVSGLSKSYNIKGVDKIVLNWEPSMELSVSKSSVKTNESVTITATLTDGVPISGENVSFLVNGVKIGEAMTDSAGEATIEYTPTSEGTYTIQGKFVFGTTENVKNASVSVSAPSSGGGIDLVIVAILIVIVIAIAAVAAFAFLRKR